MVWLAQTQAEDISIYGVISLLLMFVAAALILFYTFRRSNRSVFNKARQLPLEGDEPAERGQDTHAFDSIEVKP